MKTFLFILNFISFSAQSSTVLDILKDQDHSFALQKKLKKDIGSLFPSAKSPHAFITAFEDKNFEQALDLWLQSIKNTSFASSSTGSALYSYLLFKNGFEVLALKNLLENSQPQSIHPIVSRLWAVDINKKHPVWDHFFSPVHKKWQGFFSAKTVFKWGSKAVFQVKDKQEYIKYLLALPLDNKADVFPVEWSFVLSLIQQEEMESATKILAWLIEKTKQQSRKDRVYLTIGRLLADIGEMEASLHYYAKLKEPSYFWLFAQEEQSWIFFNKGNYGKAHSTASVFEYPQFKNVISPYMSFILASSQLKNCDYKGVTRSLSDFKLLFLKRKSEMEKILNSDDYKALIKKLFVFYHSGHSYYDTAYADLFYHIKKDRFLKNHILLYDHLENKKISKKTSPFPDVIRVQNQFTDQLREQIKVRMKTLLKKKIKDINFISREFHIIAAAALYRVYGFHPLRPLSPDLTSSNYIKESTNNILFFPFDPSEIWLDELLNYQSRRPQNCPKGNYVL